MASYPQPGTNTERILNHIQRNDHITTNGIIRQLGMNPSVVRKCLTGLVERGLVRDKPDDRGHHHYVAKSPVL